MTVIKDRKHFSPHVFTLNFYCTCQEHCGEESKAEFTLLRREQWSFSMPAQSVTWERILTGICHPCSRYFFSFIHRLCFLLYRVTKCSKLTSMYYVSIHYVPILMAWYVWVYPQRAYSLMWETTHVCIKQRTEMAQYEVQFCRSLLRTSKTNNGIWGWASKTHAKTVSFFSCIQLFLTAANFSWLKCLSKKHYSSVHYNLLLLFSRNHLCAVSNH